MAEAAGFRIGIIGDGRMGMAVAEVARERGYGIAAILGEAENAGGRAIASGALEGVDCAIEFTQPSSAVANAMACVQAGIPVVVGTTGWHDHVPEVERAVQAANGSLVWAPNFSVGVILLTELVARAGELFRQTGFHAHMVETHHARKLDAPSGTAIALARAFEAAGEAMPITSVRLGHVPGTHTITLDAPWEQITIAHSARDRRVFADGALRAAQWLVGRTGVHTMRDVLGLRTERRS